MQHPDGVGAEGEARADLAQHAGLLVDVDLEAGLAQREGGSQPADPGAHDEHAHARDGRAAPERATLRPEACPQPAVLPR